MVETASLDTRPGARAPQRRNLLSSAGGVFWRMHIKALSRRPWATALVIAGIALGTGLLVGVLMLYQAIGEPYSTLSDAIGARADLQVSPTVPGRLPEEVIRDLRSRPDVAGAVPVVGGVRHVGTRTAEASLVVMGTDCSVEVFLGEFDCADLDETLREGAEAGRTIPLILGQGAAVALGIKEGDGLGIAGGLVDTARVADIVSDGPLADINEGRWAVGLVPDVQDLLGYGPFLDAVYVATGSPNELQRQLEPGLVSASVHAPGTTSSVLIALLRVTLLFAAVLAIVCGGMIAVNSFTISLDDRRRSLAITVALGQSPVRLAASLVSEGVLLGFCGGLLAVPLSLMLGSYLTSVFGASVLGDSGLEIAAPLSSWAVILSIGAGCVAGGLAAFFPAIRLIRDGALVAVREQAGVLPSHRTPLWPLTMLMLMVPGAAGVWAYGMGYLPFTVGFLALGLTVSSMLVGFFAAVPLAVRGLNRLVRASGAVGMLAIADLLRDPFRLAAVVATVGIGVGAAVALGSGRQLVGEEVSKDLSSQVGRDMYLLPREFGSNTPAAFSDQALEVVRATKGVVTVWPQRSIILHRGATGLTVLGAPPERPRGVLADPRSQGDGKRPEDGGVLVSELVANGEDLTVGSLMTLPAPMGDVDRRVIGISQPGYAEDNGIGAVVEVSAANAKDLWNAPVTSLIVEVEEGLSSAELEGQLRDSGIVHVSTYDATEIGDRAQAYIASYLSPAIVMGLVMVVVSGLAVANFLILSLIQRRRLRAVLRFVGFSPPVERQTLLYQAFIMGAIGSLFGVIAALVTSWLFTLAFPALVATRVDWHVVWWAIGTGCFAALLICFVATVPSTVEAGNLDILNSISAE